MPTRTRICSQNMFYGHRTWSIAIEQGLWSLNLLYSHRVCSLASKTSSMVMVVGGKKHILFVTNKYIQCLYRCGWKWTVSVFAVEYHPNSFYTSNKLTEWQGRSNALVPTRNSHKITRGLLRLNQGKLGIIESNQISARTNDMEIAPRQAWDLLMLFVLPNSVFS